jgi:zinc/manganese transport system permease protein
MIDYLLSPFAEYSFMRRALVATLALSVSCAPIGVWLVLRRMSLVGDAMSHALLPGAAIGFLVAGLSLQALTIGGMGAALAVALLSGLITRWTPLREDASFAALYLISLAIGVLIVSSVGSNLDLMRFLFGSVLAVDDEALVFVAAVSTVTLIGLALIYRPLLAECFDPEFLRISGSRGGRSHMIFMGLVVLNLVSAFQAMGTLMAVGLMMLPAAAARFWAESVAGYSLVAVAIALVSSYAGLLISFYLDVASGPSIVLFAGVLYVVSVTVGPRGSLLAQHLRARHLEA